jgi:hypothetical protein
MSVFKKPNKTQKIALRWFFKGVFWVLLAVFWAGFLLPTLAHNTS